MDFGLGPAQFLLSTSTLNKTSNLLELISLIKSKCFKNINSFNMYRIYLIKMPKKEGNLFLYIFLIKHSNWLTNWHHSCLTNRNMENIIINYLPGMFKSIYMVLKVLYCWQNLQPHFNSKRNVTGIIDSSYLFIVTPNLTITIRSVIDFFFFVHIGHWLYIILSFMDSF